MLNQIIMKETTKLFYDHFLESQKTRRKKAIILLENKNFNELYKNYNHYLKTTKKGIKLEDSSVPYLMNMFVDFMTTLPPNANMPYLSEEDDNMYINWDEYEILGESMCESLAKHATNDCKWKMKNQTDGIDGKNAIKLLKKLKLKNNGQKKIS